MFFSSLLAAEDFKGASTQSQQQLHGRIAIEERYERKRIMILRLTLDLPEDARYIGTTRRLSKCLLEDINVRLTTIQDIEDIVGELCSNAVRHSASEEKRFVLSLEYYETKFVIIIRDSGIGFAEDSILPSGAVRLDAEGADRYGGYGLDLIRALSDKVEFTRTDPQGTTVRVEKNLQFLLLDTTF